MEVNWDLLKPGETEKTNVLAKSHRNISTNSTREPSLVPLGAAVYSGAVGIAACKPSFIGLTPSQFKEVKKHEWDQVEPHEDYQLMDEGTSLV